MLHQTFLTAVVVGVLTVSMTDAFATVKSSALNVLNVYETAQQIDPWNNPYGDYNQQRMALYQAAGRLEGFANTIIELEFDANGKIIASKI